MVENFADDIRYVFPLNANGGPEPWFVYDGRQAATQFQRGSRDRFLQIRMLEQG